MNGLKEWAIGLCAAAIACTALQLLLPEKGSSPLMKTLLAMFFCCCLMGPVGLIASTDWSSLMPGVEPSLSDDGQMEQAFYNTLQTEADGVLRELTEEALAGTDYSVEKIEAALTNSENGRIYMSGATAWLSVEQTPHAVEIGKRLNAALGVEVRVIPDMG